MPQTSLKEFFVKGVLAEKENEQPHPPSTNGATVEVAAKVAGATVLLDGGLCEYEKQREARIQVNLHRLAQLGLGAGLQPTPPNVRSQPKKRRREQASKREAAVAIPPERRSGRLRHQPADLEATSDAGAHQPSGVPVEHEACEEEPVVYEDSSVRQYSLAAEVDAAQQWSDLKEGRPLERFATARATYADEKLHRVYSVHSHGCLIVAGGHQGRAAIYSTRSEDDEDGITAPLMSWRAHKGWVSEVQFVSLGGTSVEGNGSAGDGGSRVLTAANDAAVKMWDVDSCDGNGEPRLMATGSYHTAGIWSADTCGARVLTSSKDGSVTSAMLTQTGIHAVRVFDEHHAGIVKCVRGRDAHVFADCGADGLVCVLDDRVAGSGVVATLDVHPYGANFVEWSPSSAQLLLSAGGDPACLLHDLRAPSAPLLRFVGHMRKPASAKGPPPYRPVFVPNCDAIATSGAGSNALSLYDTKTGNTISRGQLGFDPCTAHFGQSLLLAEACSGGGYKCRLRTFTPCMQDGGG